VVGGRITVVATGNIYVADSIRVDGTHDAQGKPTLDNPNVLSLMAKGVIKIVDPGLSSIDGGTITVSANDYEPIGIDDPAMTPPAYRCLPDPMVIEAALTIGEGGWGAENVLYGTYGGRKEYSGSTDDLIVTGSITEACRGVVGLVSPAEGFIKIYRLDARYLTGILPGDIGLRGKYVSTPAGWMDLPPGS
jgi:hypothetical protein